MWPYWVKWAAKIYLFFLSFYGQQQKHFGAGSLLQTVTLMSKQFPIHCRLLTSQFCSDFTERIFTFCLALTHTFICILLDLNISFPQANSTLCEMALEAYLTDIIVSRRLSIQVQTFGNERLVLNMTKAWYISYRIFLNRW